MSSDLEHWYITATVHKDRVEETHYISDPTKNIRRRPQTKIFHVERFLGRGGCGEVRLERNREDGKLRAVKKITILNADLSNSECEKELKALLEFSKPKSRDAAVFVEFYGWFRDGPDIFLAMEYFQLGDLERNVLAYGGKIPESEARDIAEQILSGIELMHASSFAHRDLKPQNVLVVHASPKWWVKLADFGFSKRLTDTTVYHTRSGTLPYMAPEVLGVLDANDSRSDYTNAVDIWATGCIVYRLIAGHVPFPQIKALVKYCENESLFPHDDVFGSKTQNEGSNFIRQLLASDPNLRPSASQAAKHTWIISGSNTPTPLTENPPPPQDILSEFRDLTVSQVNFNTVTHDGLKSYQSYLSGNTLPSQSSVQQAASQPPAIDKLQQEKVTYVTAVLRQPTPPTSQNPINRAHSNDIDHRARKVIPNMIVRFRGPDGMVRITVEPADTFGRIGEKLSEILPATVDLNTLTMSNSPSSGDVRSLKEIAGYEVSKVGITHGDIVFINYKHVGAL